MPIDGAITTVFTSDSLLLILLMITMPRNQVSCSPRNRFAVGLSGMLRRDAGAIRGCNLEVR